MRATAIAAALLVILIIPAAPAMAKCWSTDDRYPCGGGVDMMGQRMGFEPINPMRAIRRGKGATNVQIVSHPAGCPRALFCGCGVSVRVFGRPVRDLWQSSAWLKFPSVPRSAATGGMVGWYPGHVSYIEQVHGDGTATVYDPNSGGGRTRIQRVPLSNFSKIVNPRTAKAEKPVQVAQLASADPAIVLTDDSTVDDLAKLRPLGNNVFYGVHAEIQPKERSIDTLLKGMKDVPVGTVKEEIKLAADLLHLDADMMLAFAKIESGLNCKSRTGSYKGCFQLSDYEFRRYGRGDIYNARDNTFSAAHKFLVEAAYFRHVTGRNPTFADRYCVHQQGMAGCLSHLRFPERAAWRSMNATDEGKKKGERWSKLAIWGNYPPGAKALVKGGVDAITSGRFIQCWTARVERMAFGKRAADDCGFENRVRVAKAKVKKRYARYKKKHRYASR